MSRRQRLGASLITIGAIVMIVAGIAWLRYDQAIRLQAAVADDSARAAASANPAPKPTRLIIAGKIDIPLEPQVVDGNRTTVSPDAASYLAAGIRPGQGGNVIIYGHNKRDILGRLGEVGIGDIIEVRTEDDRSWKYRVTERSNVDPGSTELLQAQPSEMVTVYTCSGFLDSKRLVVRAVYSP